MIGTDDLNITATLKDGQIIPIFTSGEYSKELLNN